MRHVDDQAVSADKVQYGYFAVKISVKLSFFEKSPELIAEKIEEDPLQKRKIIGRKEVVTAKAEDRQPLILIQRLGQLYERIGEQPDKAVGDTVEQHEQQKEHDHADKRLHAVEHLAQGIGKKHRAAEEAEDTEPDRLVGRQPYGDDGDDDTAQTDDDTPAPAVAREVDRYARYDDEGSADQPLPDDNGNTAIKIAPYAECTKNVIAQVEEDHIDDGDTAYCVDQAVTSVVGHDISFQGQRSKYYYRIPTREKSITETDDMVIGKYC